MKHELKLSRELFQDINNGTKSFKARNDRDYKVGDFLILKEWNLNGHYYTGRELLSSVTYVLDDSNFCTEDYVLLGIRVL